MAFAPAVPEGILVKNALRLFRNVFTEQTDAVPNAYR